MSYTIMFQIGLISLTLAISTTNEINHIYLILGGLSRQGVGFKVSVNYRVIIS